jgi:hypothetical protein
VGRGIGHGKRLRTGTLPAQLDGSSDRHQRKEADTMTVRYLVDDVDAALPFYRALGFRLADRWGPPFAVLKGKGLTLWLAGPGTSARKKLASGALPAEPSPVVSGPVSWSNFTRALVERQVSAVAKNSKHYVTDIPPAEP